MKKGKNYGSPTNLPMAVTASIDELRFLEQLVKHLADARSKKRVSFTPVEEGWEAIDSSSLEVFVSGNMLISDKDEPTRLPYATSFLFTCIKETSGGFVLSGCFSLS